MSGSLDHGAPSIAAGSSAKAVGLAERSTGIETGVEKCSLSFVGLFAVCNSNFENGTNYGSFVRVSERERARRVFDEFDAGSFASIARSALSVAACHRSQRRADDTAKMLRPLATTENQVPSSSSSIRVLTEQEERDIGELFERTQNLSTKGIASMDRILRRELEDTDHLLATALESSGSALALLSECVSEVEHSMVDINAWSAVFETNLLNMRTNLATIKGQDKQLQVSAANKRSLADALEELLQKLEIPVNVENVLLEHPFEDDKSVLKFCDALEGLEGFRSRLR